MRLIPVNAVKNDAYLAQPLYNSKGQILLSKGVKMNGRYKEKIKEHGFNLIYIIDEYSDNELEDVIKPEIRRKTIEMVTSTLNTFSELNNDHISSFDRQKLDKYAAKGIEGIQQLTKHIVDDIFTQKDIMVNLVDIKNTDDYTYYHSVNVSILGLVLGTGYGLNKIDLYDLAMGCILHDIGKMFIPKSILNKKEKLTPEEYAIMQEHTSKGFNYLRDHTDLNGKIRLISLQHQEKVDGSGYPFQLKDNEIYTLSKIAAIVDVYDALTSTRPYREALPPNEAIEYIMGSGGTHFNMDMVRSFMRKVIPYPVGTVVRLSNGDLGTIEKIDPEFILRPVIKIIKQKNQKVSQFLCDLKKEHNVTIAGIAFEV